MEDYKSVIKVACLGDSITFGVGVKDKSHDSYPAQLGTFLGDKWKVANFGVSARTMLNKGDHPYQKEKALEQAVKLEPDVVVIMLGTNDSKPQNWKYKEEFPADTKTLIKRFAELPSKPRIFLCYPVPVPGKGNYGINEAGVMEEEPMIDAIAKETGAAVIDLHTPLADKPECFPDRVHPNAEGAGIMAKTVYKALTGKEAAPATTQKAKEIPDDIQR